MQNDNRISKALAGRATASEAYNAIAPTFKRWGSTFTREEYQEGRKALYRRECGHAHWEVWSLRSATSFVGAPVTTDWGRRAWTFLDRNKALEHYNSL